MGRIRNYGMGLFVSDFQERIEADRMRRERLARLRQAMMDSGVDVLYLLHEQGVRYGSGWRFSHRTYTSIGTGGLIVPREGTPILYPGIMYDEAQRAMPWAHPMLTETHVSIRGIASFSNAKAWLEDGARRLARQNIQPHLIAVDILTQGLVEAFQTVFPDAELMDGVRIFQKAVMVKTADEIRCIDNACAVSLAGIDAAREALRAGVKECEVQAESYRKMVSLGAEGTRTPGVVSSDTCPFRWYTSDRFIQWGEPVIIDIGAKCIGYHAGVARTYVCGKDGGRIPDGFPSVYQRAYRALTAAESAIKPGSTVRDLVEAASPYIAHADLGHGIGIMAVEFPILSTSLGGGASQQAIRLEPGMVLYLAPYAGEPGVGGVTLGDTVLVTEQGYEVLTPYEFEEDLLS